VVVAGAGRQGLSAARLLAQLGADLVIADDAPQELVEARVRDAGLQDATVRAGGIEEEVCDDADLVVLSAGLPRRHVALARALARGVPVVGEVEVAAAHLEGVAFAGVTGTNGKSTTTTMMGAIFKSFAPDAFAGGNLGTPLCDVVAEGRRPQLCAVELSSYQLETIQHLPLTAAVVTNLAPDHLDRYDDADAYFAAKARILALVTPGGAAALNRGDAATRRVLVDARRCRAFDFAVLAGGEGVAVDGRALEVRTGSDVVRLTLDNPLIVGPHNAENAAAAVAAAAILGVPAAHWQRGLDAWSGIPHRLERLGEVAGVSWFNDSKATNVDAAVTAVRSFSSGVRLIAGGRGKGASYAPLAEAARGRVAGVYTIGEDGPAIAAAFAGVAPVVEAVGLKDAVDHAMNDAGQGDVLLLSPACASFDQFKSFAARGDALRTLFEEAGGQS
jgi:UDP-N-acetylmuramoylalanine--D-glutamate ligase